MSKEDGRSESGRGKNRKRWHDERRIQLEAIEAVLHRGTQTGLFKGKNNKIEAAILRDMVRSTMIHSSGELSVDEMGDTIMRIFLNGIQTKA